MIEQDGPESIFEGRLHEPPHVLIAAEAVGKHHGPLARSANMDIISFHYTHDVTLDLRLTMKTAYNVSLSAFDAKRKPTSAPAHALQRRTWQASHPR